MEAGAIGRTIEDSDDFLDDLALDERQPFVAAEVRIGEPVLVEAQLVQDRGVEIAEVVGLLDGAQPDGVGAPTTCRP